MAVAGYMSFPSMVYSFIVLDVKLSHIHLPFSDFVIEIGKKFFGKLNQRPTDSDHHVIDGVNILQRLMRSAQTENGKLYFFYPKNVD